MLFPINSAINTSSKEYGYNSESFANKTNALDFTAAFSLVQIWDVITKSNTILKEFDQNYFILSAFIDHKDYYSCSYLSTAANL